MQRRSTRNSALAGLADFLRPWALLSKYLTRLRGFGGSWIEMDDVLQFLCALVRFSELQERVSLLELSGGSLVSAGKILQHEIVVRDRLFVIGGLELNFG